MRLKSVSISCKTVMVTLMTSYHYASANQWLVVSIKICNESVTSRHYSNDAKEADILDCCGLPSKGS